MLLTHQDDIDIGTGFYRIQRRRNRGSNANVAAHGVNGYGYAHRC